MEATVSSQDGGVHGQRLPQKKERERNMGTDVDALGFCLKERIAR
jgi:hypothetical protein